MTDSNATLLPCPFCGGEAETWDGAGPWHVVCTKCGTIGSPCLSEAEAIAAWNTRAERSCRDTGESRLFRCSECGFGIEDAYLADEGAYGLELDFVRFCPNCGKAVKR